MAELLAIFIGTVLVDLDISKQRRVDFLHVCKVGVIANRVEGE